MESPLLGLFPRMGPSTSIKERIFAVGTTMGSIMKSHLGAGRFLKSPALRYCMSKEHPVEEHAKLMRLNPILTRESYSARMGSPHPSQVLDWKVFRSRPCPPRTTRETRS